jgi:ribose/xylose/arabinose/galactoside ABC-type transport system permease subunit
MLPRQPEVANAVTAPVTGGASRRLLVSWEVVGLPLAFAALVTFFSIAAPHFAEPQNFANVARQVAVLGLIGAAQTVVVLSAGVDLSVGATLAVANLLMAMGLRDGNAPLGVIMALGSGLLFGAVNGVLIGKTRIAPFIVTLGMLSIARGTALTMSGGNPIFGLPDSAFFEIGTGYMGPIPIPVLFAVTGFVVLGFVLLRTAFGTYVYAVGGNEQAALLAGVPVARIKIAVYMLSGLFAAVGGIILTARVRTGQPLLGEGLELDSIATVVIGGTSLFGGRGGLVGTLFGVLFVGVLQNGLNLMGISTFVQRIVIGVAIILAVLLTVLREERR